jgi:hypothetical protein
MTLQRSINIRHMQALGILFAPELCHLHGIVRVRETFDPLHHLDTPATLDLQSWNDQQHTLLAELLKHAQKSSEFQAEEEQQMRDERYEM